LYDFIYIFQVQPMYIKSHKKF